MKNIKKVITITSNETQLYLVVADVEKSFNDTDLTPPKNPKLPTPPKKLFEVNPYTVSCILL